MFSYLSVRRGRSIWANNLKMAISPGEHARLGRRGWRFANHIAELKRKSTFGERRSSLQQVRAPVEAPEAGALSEVYSIRIWLSALAPRRRLRLGRAARQWFYLKERHLPGRAAGPNRG